MYIVGLCDDRRTSRENRTYKSQCPYMGIVPVELFLYIDIERTAWPSAWHNLFVHVTGDGTAPAIRCLYIVIFLSFYFS